MLAGQAEVWPKASSFSLMIAKPGKVVPDMVPLSTDRPRLSCRDDHEARRVWAMHHAASWHRTSARHLAADLGRVGTLMVWRDPRTSTGTWSTFVLGTQLTGFMTAAAAQAAAIRIARAQLEEALRKLAELAMTDATQTGLAAPTNLH
jgi:hypothetical protein